MGADIGSLGSGHYASTTGQATFGLGDPPGSQFGDDYIQHVYKRSSARDGRQPTDLRAIFGRIVNLRSSFLRIIYAFRHRVGGLPPLHLHMDCASD